MPSSNKPSSMPSEGRSPACFPRSILYPARKAVARFLCPGNNSIPATSLISLPVFRGRRISKLLSSSPLSVTERGTGKPRRRPGWASYGVAARGCVSGRGPRAQRSGRDSPGGAYRPKPTRPGGKAWWQKGGHPTRQQSRRQKGRQGSGRTHNGKRPARGDQPS